MPSRYFSLQEANDLVPWLKETFNRLIPLIKKAGLGQRELLELLRETKRNGASSSDTLISANQQEVNELGERLNAMLRQVTDNGIVVRDAERGLVDFPSLRDGREICLCWIPEEDEVRFWHEIDAGFAGRQPL